MFHTLQTYLLRGGLRELSPPFFPGAPPLDFRRGGLRLSLPFAALPFSFPLSLLLLLLLRERTGLGCQCSKYSHVELPICAHALPEATLHAPLPGKARHTGRWPVTSEHKKRLRAQGAHARQVRSCTSRMEPHREEPDDDPDALLPLPGFRRAMTMTIFNLQGNLVGSPLSVTERDR